MRLGGHVEFARTFEITLDTSVNHGGFDGVEVLPAETLQDVDLVGEALDAVAQAMGDAGCAESTVAARCRPSAAVALEQHHVVRRIVGLGHECSPQPGVAAAHHHQIGGRRTDQGKCRLGGGLVVQPEGERSGVGERQVAVHGGEATGQEDSGGRLIDGLMWGFRE